MMKMMIMALSNTLNINFMLLNHPMSMMILIIFQTFSISLMAGSMMESYWLSYILFLTFLGGMLVLFIYITSIASNEMFHLSSNEMITSLIIWLTILLFILSISLILFNDLEKNSDTLTLINPMINYQEMSLSLSKLYNNPTFSITMMMMVYLFLALLAVVKITNINQGPIRKMNY
uniref:NADH-ubiquinone oxidoreductase chain 6 n=1 Tax=Pyrgacris descampsi TaxID=1260745 RepID=M4JDJ4_9ORTH|nr:NADH dehydrogenase subunit 6 [Pyrgacris descampsi]AGC22345.1 NADH dehydrogenase subunit 6 [Pyrgacris descampsi]